MIKVVLSQEAKEDLTEMGDNILSENTVQIDRILYGRRDYRSILFGTELTDETSE